MTFHPSILCAGILLFIVIPIQAQSVTFEKSDECNDPIVLSCPNGRVIFIIDVVHNDVQILKSLMNQCNLKETCTVNKPGSTCATVTYYCGYTTFLYLEISQGTGGKVQSSGEYVGVISQNFAAGSTIPAQNINCDISMPEGGGSPYVAVLDLNPFVNRSDYCFRMLGETHCTASGKVAYEFQANFPPLDSNGFHTSTMSITLAAGYETIPEVKFLVLFQDAPTVSCTATNYQSPGAVVSTGATKLIGYLSPISMSMMTMLLYWLNK